jgi:hypothetical protein
MFKKISEIMDGAFDRMDEAFRMMDEEFSERNDRNDPVCTGICEVRLTFPGGITAKTTTRKLGGKAHLVTVDVRSTDPVALITELRRVALLLEASLEGKK